MLNQIKWHRKALRQLSKIDAGFRKTIKEKTQSQLSQFKPPAKGSVVKLTNHRFDYRLRVGQYRVLFNYYRESWIIIDIMEVKKRDERTY